MLAVETGNFFFYLLSLVLEDAGKKKKEKKKAKIALRAVNVNVAVWLAPICAI